TLHSFPKVSAEEGRGWEKRLESVRKLTTNTIGRRGLIDRAPEINQEDRKVRSGTNQVTERGKHRESGRSSERPCAAGTRRWPAGERQAALPNLYTRESRCRRNPCGREDRAEAWLRRGGRREIPSRRATGPWRGPAAAGFLWGVGLRRG